MSRNLPRCARSNARCALILIFSLLQLIVMRDRDTHPHPAAPGGRCRRTLGGAGRTSLCLVLVHLGHFAPGFTSSSQQCFQPCLAAAGEERKVQLLEVASAEISDCSSCTSAPPWCNPTSEGCELVRGGIGGSPECTRSLPSSRGCRCTVVGRHMAPACSTHSISEAVR